MLTSQRRQGATVYLAAFATAGMALASGESSGDPATYRMYPPPVESPNHTLPAPPADARILVVDPADPLASPFGWHDTDGSPGAEHTTTRGNNVSAYADVDADNGPSEGEAPEGGAALLFDFALDLTAAPASYREAAVVNLFGWTNFCHDLLHRYGFDEVAGNLQHDDYGNGGLAGDALLAEAQDGSGTNGGNISVPPDGVSPRLQMFVWNLTSPHRDGALDNGVVVHEYFHAVSRRLTGGPSNVSCLGNAEQIGEGWSDFAALALTAPTSSSGADPRGIGTYLLGQPTDGPGFRTHPYSTDVGVDPRTYADTLTAAVPHGVGSIGGAVLWEVYWELVEAHGFNPDLAGDWTTGGNNLALQLVVDGLKLQPCSPGFVDVRDAILIADQALTGGVNACPLWTAFAKRGVGFSANQGSPNSNGDNVAAFDLPPHVCGVFADGFESGSTSAWSASVP